MNLCFLTGKILNKVDLQFIYGDKKKISVVELQLLIDNGSIALANGYNEIADYMYRYFKQGNKICITGRILSNIIEIKEIITI